VLTTGLQRAKDDYMQKLTELSKAKPNADETLLASLARYDAQITVAKDDLVSSCWCRQLTTGCCQSSSYQLAQ
jgi:hypothetical protein